MLFGDTNLLVVGATIVIAVATTMITTATTFGRDRERIKNLEEDVELLRQKLARRNDTLYDNQRKMMEMLTEIRERIARLEAKSGS